MEIQYQKYQILLCNKQEKNVNKYFLSQADQTGFALFLNESHSTKFGLKVGICNSEGKLSKRF